MNVSDFLDNSSERFKSLTSMLNQMYGLEIDWNSGDDHLQSVLEHYEAKRYVLTEQKYSSATFQDNNQYTKNVLIVEAIRIYLKEIAPKRIKKKFMVKK